MRPASGTSRVVVTRAERWHLTLWRDDDPDEDAISVELERSGHNFDGSMNAREAASMIDALLELLPKAREHSRLAGPRPSDRPTSSRAPRRT